MYAPGKNEEYKKKLLKARVYIDNEKNKRTYTYVVRSHRASNRPSDTDQPIRVHSYRYAYYIGERENTQDIICCG